MKTFLRSPFLRSRYTLPKFPVETRKRLFSDHAEPKITKVDTEDILDDYPILLVDVENNNRQAYFGSNPNWAWYENLIFAKLRQIFALGAGTAFINNRFPDIPDTESSSNSDPKALSPYFPTAFMEAPKFAMSTLFEQLSGWDGSDKAAEERGLHALLKPQIYEKFRRAHQELNENGCVLTLSLKPEEDPVRIKGIWITFGPRELATSTVLRGPIKKRYSTFAFTRRATNHLGNSMLIFREEVFEYCMTPGAAAELAVLPNYSTKNQVVGKGQVVGVDVEFEGTVSFQVSRKVEVDGSGKQGELILKDNVQRLCRSRLESTFFDDEFPDDGAWLFADVDNYIVSDRVKEEISNVVEDD
ncbi:hypothetical protein HDU97_006961 [Phlyctochytrium planicorne]|nr:hypothetical protein HDU97_006961 [Phlyctochytrium planicorne]